MLASKMRRYWLTAHLYLGLLLGGFFVVLGLTGSFLVFYNEIDRTINAEIINSANSKDARPLQDVLYTLRTAYPERINGWRIELPIKEGSPIMARYMQPVEKAGKHFAPLVVILDAHTHQITSSRFWGDFLVTWIYDLHYTLLLEDLGKTSLAIIGSLILCSLLTGLYLWWPRQGNFKKALAIRRDASIIRKTYDWHKTSGLIGFVLLLLLAVTGVMLEKPKWFEPALAKAAPLFEMPEIESIPSSQTVTLDQIKSIAELHFPNAEVRWIYTPDDVFGVYQVRMYQAGEPSRRFPKTILWIDQYGGEVLAERDAKQDVVGDVILQWLHPLHNGEAFGLLGRWLVFFTGFVPAILFVTGIMRWQHKLRVKNVRIAK